MFCKQTSRKIVKQHYAVVMLREIKLVIVKQPTVWESGMKPCEGQHEIKTVVKAVLKVV